MKKDRLELWEEIYAYAVEIVAFDPWSRFKETDTLALIPKGKRAEHFFSFISESRGQLGIAIYRDGDAYFDAMDRLHRKNRKKEPVFLLQNATIFLFGDRENVSKENYALIKELGLKCRGRGNWPHFEKYRIGYAPQAIPDAELEELLDDLGNLWMMVKLAYENDWEIPADGKSALVRTYSKKDDMFYTTLFPIEKPKQISSKVITMDDNPWLRQVRKMPAKGTVSLDWSYLPTIMDDEGTDVVPRLLLAVEPKTGLVLKHRLMSPLEDTYGLLFQFITELIELRGKPATIEICDKELENCLADLCQRTGMRLSVRSYLPQLATARNELVKTLI